MKKFFAFLMVAVMVMAMGVTAFADTSTIAEDGSVALTLDVTGTFTAEDSWAQFFLQTYGEAFTISSVTIVINGETVDVTQYMDSTDNHMTFMLADENSSIEGGYCTDNGLSPADITSVTYNIVVDPAKVADGTWYGGQIGTNSETAGWNGTGKSWGTDEGRDIVIVLADAGEPAGDATPVVAVAIMAMVSFAAVTVLRKKEA